MASTAPLKELLVEARLDGSSERVVFTERSFAHYPTPLVPRGSWLTRPVAVVTTEEPEELVLPQRWWDRRDLPLVYAFRQYRQLDRIVFNGAQAFEMVEHEWPWLEGSALLCVRLPASDRIPAGLPISLKAVGTTPSAILGDDFVGLAVATGLLLTGDEAGAGTPAIVHVGGEHAADVASRQRCRLLCVHIPEGNPWHVLEELAKHSPAHAIIVVSGTPGEFFPTLYRKILHDVPIDRAVIEARSSDIALRASFAIGFRPGGETDLLLTRLAATQAGLLEWPLYMVLEETPVDPDADDIDDELGAIYDSEPGEDDARRVKSLSRFRELTPSSVPDEGESFQLDSAGSEIAGEVSLEGAQSTPVGSHPPEQTRGEKVRERFEALLPSRQDLARRLATASASAFDQEIHTLDEVTRLARDGADSQLAKEALARGSFGEPRWTQAWFEGEGALPLKPDVTVTLVVQIVTERREGAAAAEFPFARIAHLFRDAASVALDIEIYGAPDDWCLEERKHRLMLPAEGKSDAVCFGVTPKRTGLLPLRICVYSRNLLVQSLLLEVTSGPLIEGEPPLRMELDYVTSVDFQFLEDRPSPALSIFQNDAEDTHWLGPRVDGQDPLGTLHPLPFAALDGPLKAAREALFDVHEQCSARYGYKDPLAKAEHRQKQLVHLARAGCKFHEALFNTNALQKGPRAPALAARVPHGQLVSVTRLRNSAPKIPWQMVYDRPLYASSNELVLCPHAATEIPKGPITSCAATCPAPESDEAENIVCPLGFWGLRYRLEEPLALVDVATEKGEWKVPRPANSPGVDRTEVRRGLGVHVAYNASLGTHRAHLMQLQSPAIRGQLEVYAPYATGREMRTAIRKGDGTLFYFYCHGEYRGEDDFSLVLRAQPPDVLTDADLAPTGRTEPAFLAFLNVCDSSNVRSDASRRLLTALRNLGAIGIVSSETEVREAFGKEFAESLISKLGGGTSLGQAFFELRWEFVVKAWDASAFVYSLNGLDALRLV